jgi:hypothetical protein
MQQKFGICLQCEQQKPINSKQICGDCVYSNNHQGKSKQEILVEKRNKRVESIRAIKPIVTTISKRKPLKHSKKRIKHSDKSKERREEAIRKDEELYEYIFNTKPPFCEECGTRLPDEFRDEEGRVIMRSQYSHIMTKGGFPEFRHDGRNVNRLCFEDHQRWEFSDRKNMRIYESNQIIIQELLDERNKNEI